MNKIKEIIKKWSIKIQEKILEKPILEKEFIKHWACEDQWLEACRKGNLIEVSRDLPKITELKEGNRIIRDGVISAVFNENVNLLKTMVHHERWDDQIMRYAYRKPLEKNNEIRSEALAWACQEGRLESVKWIMRQWDRNQGMPGGGFWSEKEKIKISEGLLKASKNKEEGHIQVIRWWLLESGQDMDFKDLNEKLWMQCQDEKRALKENEELRKMLNLGSSSMDSIDQKNLQNKGKIPKKL